MVFIVVGAVERKRRLEGLMRREPWSEDLADLLLARYRSLWNMYGPTETTVWSAVWRIEPGDRVLIGRLIANTQFYVAGTRLVSLKRRIWPQSFASAELGWRGPPRAAGPYCGNVRRQSFGGSAQDQLY